MDSEIYRNIEKVDLSARIAELMKLQIHILRQLEVLEKRLKEIKEKEIREQKYERY